jgi:hypothetical protein
MMLPKRWQRQSRIDARKKIREKAGGFFKKTSWHLFMQILFSQTHQWPHVHLYVRYRTKVIFIDTLDVNLLT